MTRMNNTMTIRLPRKELKLRLGKGWLFVVLRKVAR